MLWGPASLIASQGPFVTVVPFSRKLYCLVFPLGRGSRATYPKLSRSFSQSRSLRPKKWISIIFTEWPPAKKSNGRRKRCNNSWHIHGWQHFPSTRSHKKNLNTPDSYLLEKNLLLWPDSLFRTQFCEAPRPLWDPRRSIFSWSSRSAPPPSRRTRSGRSSLFLRWHSNLRFITSKIWIDELLMAFLMNCFGKKFRTRQPCVQLYCA